MNLRKRMRTTAAARAAEGGSGGRGATDTLLRGSWRNDDDRARLDAPEIVEARLAQGNAGLETGGAGALGAGTAVGGSLEVALEVVVQQRADFHHEGVDERPQEDQSPFAACPRLAHGLDYSRRRARFSPEGCKRP